MLLYVNIDDPDVDPKTFSDRSFQYQWQVAKERIDKKTVLVERMQAKLAERRAKKDLDK